MTTFCSLFRQILNTIPKSQFDQLVRQHRSEFHARGFTSWQQFVAMLFCHLGRAQSLREIEHGLRSAEGKLSHLGISVPKRSTLSYANAHRPWELYRSVFYALLEQCRHTPGGRRFRFKNKLLSLDSTTVEVVSEMYAWAKYNKSKGAIKLHLMLDHAGFLPAFAVVTDGKKADVTVGRDMPLPSGSIVVFDRGYVDYEWFRKLGQDGIFFVTRLKKNCHYRVVEERQPVRGIIRDDLVDVYDVTKARNRKYVPLRMRRIEVADPDGGANLVFCSNHLELGATTISAVYKDRWQIELFFKSLKQNLKIKTFIGTSSNAIHIQLWTALIAMLLVRYLKLKSECTASLSNLFAMLRFHLFAYRELWEWLRKPFDPIDPPPPLQLSLI
jgi:hypothetical protein